MDAPLTPTDLIRPWRLATLAASLIAGIELVALVLLGFLLLAKPLSHAIQRHATSTATAAVVKNAHVAPARHTLIKPPPVGVAKVPRSHTSVLVLNGNGRAGVAHVEAARLQHLGYRIGGAANAKRSDYATTVVMFKGGFAAEGHRLARDLHVSVVGPLDGMTPAALHGSQLVVVLGAR